MNPAVLVFVAGTRPISHRVGRSVGRSVGPSVGRSVGPSHFTFFAFLGILRVGKFVVEHAPAQIMTAPAQIIIAPAHRPRREQSCIRPCFSSFFVCHIVFTPGEAGYSHLHRAKLSDSHNNAKKYPMERGPAKRESRLDMTSGNWYEIDA